MTIRARMTRTLAVGFILTTVGCAGQPMLGDADRSACVVPAAEAASGSSVRAPCDATRAAWAGGPIGGVQQTGSQTRTVGVPRGFLIAMIVLFVLMVA